MLFCIFWSTKQIAEFMTRNLAGTSVTRCQGSSVDTGTLLHCFISIKSHCAHCCEAVINRGATAPLHAKGAHWPNVPTGRIGRALRTQGATHWWSACVFADKGTDQGDRTVVSCPTGQYHGHQGSAGPGVTCLIVIIMCIRTRVVTRM